MQFSSTQLTQILAFSRTSIKTTDSHTSSIGQTEVSVHSNPLARRHDGQKKLDGPRFDFNDGDDLAICV
jgi:hypothetical protein